MSEYKYVSKEEFLRFLKESRKEIIGTDAKGNDTSVQQEFFMLYKLCVAYVDAVNAYDYAIKNEREMSADEAIHLSNRCDRTLERAIKKLCFMNSVADKKFNCGFLVKLINRGSRKSCNEAVIELFDIVNDVLDNNSFIAQTI